MTMCKMMEVAVTCFACGISSSAMWSRKVRRGPPHPFYPQLENKECPPGAIVFEDGSVNLCAFCHALYDSHTRQGTSFLGEEKGKGSGSKERFVCAVCAVETYRKRVRALPAQKFQFLSKIRKPGSVSFTLGESECVVVCLDCSETLWIQSDEYDRWGLPENKRHFNWMARPPPPEDSEEAHLARLPSGKAQLPRSPLTVASTCRENGIALNGCLRLDRSNSTSSSSSNSNMTYDFRNTVKERKKRRVNVPVSQQQTINNLELSSHQFLQFPQMDVLKLSPSFHMVPQPHPPQHNLNALHHHQAMFPLTRPPMQTTPLIYQRDLSFFNLGAHPIPATTLAYFSHNPTPLDLCRQQQTPFQRMRKISRALSPPNISNTIGHSSLKKSKVEEETLQKRKISHNNGVALLPKKRSWDYGRGQTPRKYIPSDKATCN